MSEATGQRRSRTKSEVDLESMYCADCRIAIDARSISKHRGHYVSDIVSHAEDVRRTSEEYTKKLAFKLDECQQKTRRLEDLKTTRETMVKETIEAITKQCNIMHGLINDRKASLSEHVYTLKQEEDESIDQYLRENEDLKEQLKTWIGSTRQLARNNIDHAVIRGLDEQKEHLDKILNSNIEDPDSDADWGFEPAAETNHGELVGRIRSTDDESSTSFCDTNEKFTERPILEKLSVSRTINCSDGVQSLALCGDESIIATVGMMTKIKAFTGLCSHATSIGTDGPHGILRATGIASLSDDTFAVCDADKGDVKIFRVDGEYVRSLVLDVKSPQGLTQISDGRIAVCHDTSKCVAIYEYDDESCKMVAQFPDENEAVLKTPRHVAKLGDDGLVVGDDGADSVLAFRREKNAYR